MGFFSFLKGNKNETESGTSNVPTQESQKVCIDMSKDNLNKVLINMSKDNRIDMTKHVARVAVAMDYSGSMSDEFRDGKVQDVITRLLPIALRFDDNKELECWLFSNGEEKLEAISEKNYENYVNKVMLKARMNMGWH